MGIFSLKKIFLSQKYSYLCVLKLKIMNLNNAMSMAWGLMKEHGLIEKGWSFEFINAKRRFGVCRYRNRIIGLSSHLVSLNDEAQVKDTTLHEIAHALVGGGHGHNEVWKAKCREIGARPERCYSNLNVKTPEMRYYAECDCGRTAQRIKKPLAGRSYACHCQSELPWSRKKLLIFKDRFGRI